MKYIPPEFQKSAFNCPYCNVFSQMDWSRLSGQFVERFNSQVYVSLCNHCRDVAYWKAKTPSLLREGHLLIPFESTAPLPHEEMPEAVKPDYIEAREVCGASPRAAAALLRLAIQKLCKELGQPGKNINNDIASLVKNGLPVKIQQALDIIRVVGNNSVHPGELNSKDVAEVALPLFELLNKIVEEMIAKPNKLKELFDKLPKGAREAIKTRDSKS